MAINISWDRNLARLARGVLGSLLLAMPPVLWAGAGHPCTSRAADGKAEAKAFRIASLLGDDAPFTIGGWTQFGYEDASTGVFNTHPHEFNLRQQWLYAGRVADGRCGLDFGFRVDVVYGVDAQNTQAFGEPPPQRHWDTGWDLGRYGWALPQAYVEVAYGNWHAKIGHFYTFVGYEAVPALNNFFYSHAFTFNFNEPFTHTGVFGSYQASSAVTLYGGWTAGWDTGFARFRPAGGSKGSSFLGGVRVALGHHAFVTYALTAGELGFPQGEGYSHSLVVYTSPAAAWKYVFQYDLVEVNANPLGPSTNHRHAFNNYLFYTINGMFRAGVRGEWFRSGSHSLYEITAGVNVRPLGDFVIRPEVRWQFAGNNEDKQFFANQFGIPTGGTIFGVDAVLTY